MGNAVAVAENVLVAVELGREEGESAFGPLLEREVPERLLETAVRVAAIRHHGLVRHEVAGNRMEDASRRARRNVDSRAGATERDQKRDRRDRDERDHEENREETPLEAP